MNHGPEDDAVDMENVQELAVHLGVAFEAYARTHDMPPAHALQSIVIFLAAAMEGLVACVQDRDDYNVPRKLDR